MPQVDLDAEIRVRKEKILTLKHEIETLAGAKEVLEGKDTGHPIDPTKKENDPSDE